MNQAQEKSPPDSTVETGQVTVHEDTSTPDNDRQVEPARLPSEVPEDLAREVVAKLQEPTEDRSDRDLQVLCTLVRAGIKYEAAWELVAPFSKFAEREEDYFNETYAAAIRTVRAEVGSNGRGRNGGDGNGGHPHGPAGNAGGRSRRVGD